MRRLSAIFATAIWLAVGYFGLGGCSSSTTPPPAEDILHALTVVVTGAGMGSVTADTGDIDCRKDSGACSADLKESSSVTLTAASDEGYVFLGWYGGECAGAGPCTVTLDEARTVRAAFALLTYSSNRRLDGSDATTSGPVNNIFVMKTDGTDLTPLTVSESAGQGSGFPNWSPDGETLAFSAPGVDLIGDTTIPNVWVVNGDGSGLQNGLANLTRLSNAASFGPAWSPDGTRIAFLSKRRIDGTDALNDNETSNLWIMNADGTDPKPLTQLTADFADVNGPLFWSPQGDKIYFRSARDLDLSDHAVIGGTTNIWAIRPDGTDLSAVTALATPSVYLFLDDMSPDGTTLLFESDRHIDGGDHKNMNSVTNIWTIRTDGTEAKPLTTYTTSGVFTSGPACFSGDGAKAFYTTNALLDGSDAAFPVQVRNIWSVNGDGTEPTPLTKLEATGDFQAGMDTTPDDSRLFFVSDRDLSGEDLPTLPAVNVWSMNEDGSDLRPLTELTVGGLDSARSAKVSR